MCHCIECMLVILLCSLLCCYELDDDVKNVCKCEFVYVHCSFSCPKVQLQCIVNVLDC